LFDLRKPTQGKDGGAVRLFGGHALPNVFRNLLFQMRTQFFLHFLIHLIGMEERTQTQWKRIEPLFELHV
jgi:hypothetical protein